MALIDQFVPFGKCRDLAYSILCHTMYPYCDISQSLIPRPRLICKESCYQFNNIYCTEYTTKIKQENNDLYQLLVSHCDMSHSKGGDPPECIPLSINASRTGTV